MERYDELGTYLAENGVLVFGHDHGEIISAKILLSEVHVHVTGVRVNVC